MPYEPPLHKRCFAEIRSATPDSRRSGVVKIPTQQYPADLRRILHFFIVRETIPLVNLSPVEARPLMAR